MNRGGARKGAGRPKGREPTKAIRLPLSLVQSLQAWGGLMRELPLYTTKVAAGLPSPIDDDKAEAIDLTDHLIKHPAATFLVRATGDSMINAGIFENDILVVDRQVAAQHGKIVIASVDGQLTVKRLQQKAQGRPVLMPDNPNYSPIEVKEGSDVFIWGVVTYVIHSV